jgi:hypothetical protein
MKEVRKDMLSDLLSLLLNILDTFLTDLRWMFSLVLSLLLATLSVLLLLSGRIGYTFLRLRGQHHVLCPEDAMPATIQIYALRSAISSIVNDPKGTVRTCSRWPERNGCAQKCLRYTQATL